MRAPSGWYDDPGGSGQLRWWDGEAWTTSTAVSRSAPRPSTGDGTVGIQRVPDVTGWASPRPKVGRAVSLALATSLLVAGAGAGIFVAIGGGGGDEGFGTEAAAAPVGLRPGAPLEAGTVTAGVVPSHGSWQATIESTGGRVVIDVRGLGGADPVAGVYDLDGVLIARNDDRSGGDRDRWGGRRVDALIDTHLPPGTYVLQVREYDGDAADVQVRLQMLDGRRAD